jgi:hypothetical protein
MYRRAVLESSVICEACEQASHNGDLVHPVEAGVLERADDLDLPTLEL